MIEVYFDGLCDPNPGGIATYGFVVKRGGKKVHVGHGLACPPKTPSATNNLAEYTGLLKALEYLVGEKTKEPVVVRGDSDLVVRQVRGEYKVKSPNLVPLHRRAGELIAKLPGGVRLEHVPRERNAEADRETNLALAEYRGESLSAPLSSVMTVDLVMAAPPDRVAAALRGASLKARTSALPDGATRVQCDLPAEEAALRPLLDLKRRLEG